MRKAVFGILLFLNVISVHAQTIDEMLRERVDAGETPGIVVAIHKDGKTTYHAFGYADAAAQKKPDSKTLFEIGSITKTFTTTVISQMAQEGKVKLSDAVQSQLPKEVTIPTRGDKVITFEDLATAHSGLPRMPDNFNPPDFTDPYLFYTEEKMFAFLNGYKLTRDIGSQYEYSNLGMGLLGVAASKIDGKPYGEVVERRILKPLKMNSTFLNTPGRKDKNSALGHSDGKPVHPWTWNDGSSMQGAGGLLSNAEDMMDYLLANMNPKDNSLGRAMQDAHKIRRELGGPSNMKIGLGWHIRDKIIWHNGGTGGFRTFAGFEPEKKMAVVVLTNSNTGADDIGFHLMDETVPLKKIRRPVTVAAEKLKTYVGNYEISPTFRLQVTEENGQLSVQATGQPKFNLFAESETKFYLKVVDAQVEFVANDQGVIDKLILYQNGAARTGIRKP